MGKTVYETGDTRDTHGYDNPIGTTQLCSSILFIIEDDRLTLQAIMEGLHQAGQIADTGEASATLVHDELKRMEGQELVRRKPNQRRPDTIFWERA